MNIGAGTYEFVSNRPQFEAHAHTVSAVTMFAGIVLVILINALSAGGRGNAKVFVRLYGLIAITMGVALAIIVVIRWKNPDWSHLAIYVEFVLIVTFAVFWGVQTKELWNVSDRRELLPEGADPTGK